MNRRTRRNRRNKSEGGKRRRKSEGGKRNRTRRRR